MFGKNHHPVSDSGWFHTVLMKIDQGVSALQQDVASIKSDQRAMAKQNDRLDQRVTDIESVIMKLRTSEVQRVSQWNGPKAVAAVVASLVPIVIIVNYITGQYVAM